jgi:hypothetical protein
VDPGLLREGGDAVKRWRGLVDLVVDAVDHGSAAVERVHLWTARKPFDLIALVPPLARPARSIAAAQGFAISAVYQTIREVAHLAGAAIGLGLDLAGRRPKGEPRGEADGSFAGPSRRDFTVN